LIRKKKRGKGPGIFSCSPVKTEGAKGAEKKEPVAFTYFREKEVKSGVGSLGEKKGGISFVDHAKRRKRARMVQGGAVKCVSLLGGDELSAVGESQPLPLAEEGLSCLYSSDNEEGSCRRGKGTNLTEEVSEKKKPPPPPPFFRTAGGGGKRDGIGF